MNIRLIGGPLHGRLHEVEGHRPIPNAIGMRCGGELCWYEVNIHDLTATYTHSTDPYGHEEDKRAEHCAMQRELGWFFCGSCRRTVPPNLTSKENGVCKLCRRK